MESSEFLDNAKDILKTLKNKLSELEFKRKEYTSKSKYLKAEKTQKKIEVLTKSFYENQKTAIKHKQAKELQNLQSGKFQMVNQFSKHWKNRFSDYSGKCTTAVHELEKKHNDEIKQLRNSFDGTSKPKYSSDFLNYLKMFNHLVKQNQHKEAHVMKKKLNSMEKELKKHWKHQQTVKASNFAKKLKRKQDSETNFLEMKIQSGLNELNKRKNQELDSLNKRILNYSLELESKHNLETNKLTNTSARVVFSKSTSPGRSSKFLGSKKSKVLNS